MDGHEDQEPERVLERLQERDELRGAGLLRKEEKYQTDIVTLEVVVILRSRSRPQFQYIKHSARQRLLAQTSAGRSPVPTPPWHEGRASHYTAFIPAFRLHQ